MVRTFKAWLLSIAAVCLLASCGGGGGGDAGSPILGGGDGTPTASDLTLTLTSAELPNNGTDTLTVTATAVDANRNALPGIAVTLAVNSGAVITGAATTTDDVGRVSGQVGIGADKTARVITVTAVSGSLSRSISFRVRGGEIAATLVPAVVAPSTPAAVEFRLVDASNNPIADESITVTGPDGVQTSGVTGVNGEFEYQYTSPATAGPAEIRVAAGGLTDSVTVEVQAPGGSIPAASGIVRAPSVSVNPSVVAVNVDGSTTNRTEVQARFLGDANAPIARVRVRFDLAGDPQSIGGTFTSGTGLVYSNANGVALAAYVPGSRSSPPDGVIVRACWDYNDFAVGTCPNAVTKTLTVVSEPLSVSIGFDDRIEDNIASLSYIKRFVVQVVDSAGQAKAGVQVSAPVDLLRYYKGDWVIVGERWVQQVRASCDNEDLNRNGSNEVYSNGAIEDANGSFNLVAGRPALEPRKADVAISFEGSSLTNSAGQVVLRLTYPQNLASWVDFNLIVSASGVGGSEGKANVADRLPALAAQVNDINSSPPFQYSPYGTETSPVLYTENPDGANGMLCTNPN